MNLPLDDMEEEYPKSKKKRPAMNLPMWPMIKLHDLPAPKTEFGCKELGNYSWVKQSIHPTILIPGKPPIYIEKRTPFKLRSDRCTPGVGRSVDENRARLPSFPLEPLFVTLDVLYPQICWDDIHNIITDRSNLRKLIRAIKLEDSEWKIRVSCINNCLLFTRYDEVLDVDTMGYGGSFEKKMTKHEPYLSGYRSIQKVKLGPLRMIVRSETDAMEKREDFIISDLAQSMKKLSTAMNSSSKSKWTDLHYVRSEEKKEILERIYIELKTKNEKYLNTIDWEDTYYQMLFGGVKRVVWGLQDRGNFKTIKSYCMHNQNQLRGGFKQRIEETLGKLESLMARIITVVKRKHYQHCDIIYTGKTEALCIIPTLKSECIPEGWVLPVKKEYL